MTNTAATAVSNPSPPKDLMSVANSEETIEQMARAMAASWGYRWEPCENGCDEICDCLATEGDDDWERPSQADFLKAARAALVVTAPPVRETLPELEIRKASYLECAGIVAKASERWEVGSLPGKELTHAENTIRAAATRLAALPPETGS